MTRCSGSCSGGRAILVTRTPAGKVAPSAEREKHCCAAVGGGFAESHMGEAGRGRMGSEFHGERSAHDNFRHDHDHRFRVVGPFFDDDGYYDYGSNCWQSERIHTPAGWRWHRVWVCY
jgi:hypothetical protein